MTRKDIDNIIRMICPNDEDFERPCISPAYLKKELEALALEQEPCEDAISREEAIEKIQHKLNLAVDDALIMSDTEYEVLQVCLKTLQQEPCEDAISRKAVKEVLAENVNIFRKVDIDDALYRIENLSSVAPIRPKGKWVFHERDIVHIGMPDRWECGCCGIYVDREYNYCPECGSYNGGDK